MNKYNPTSERIKRNLDYLMRINGINSVSAFSKVLNIPATTIYSFLNNPTSNSKVKFLICDYFDVDFEELENIDLCQIHSDMEESVEHDLDKSILSMNDDDILNYLYDGKTDDKEIENLKNSINKILFTSYRKCCTQAKSAYAAENYQKALYLISSAFWLLKPNETKYITKGDLTLYVNVAKHFNDSDQICNLILKLDSVDYYDYKIMLVLSRILEKDFPTEAKKCLKIIKQKSI